MIDNVNSHCVSLNYALHPDPKQKFAKDSLSNCSEGPTREAFPSIHALRNSAVGLGEVEPGKGKAYGSGGRGHLLT